MLRLLILLTAATAQAAPPADDEPKPPTAAVTIVGGRVGAIDKTRTGPFLFVQDYLGQTGERASDLNLVRPDDALRAQLKLPEDRGLVATSVRPHSSAWEAEIRENDVLLTLDGSPLAKPEDLDEKLKQAGEKQLNLELIRKGARITLRVQARTQVRVEIGPVDREPTSYLIGVDVLPAEPALRAQLDIPKLQGVVVTRVTKDSPAERSDIKINDVILTLAGQVQQDLKTLWEVVQKSGGKPIAVEFLREGVRRTVQVTPEKGEAGRQSEFRSRGSDWASTIVRPGVFQATQLPYPLVSVKEDPHTPDASAKRLDEMASEIKELRKAIDSLRKVLEERK